MTTDDPAARLAGVRDQIDRALRLANRDDTTTLIAISKTHPVESIRPLIAAGQRVFGENRVQEAKEKWSALREEAPGLVLHLVGHLLSLLTGRDIIPLPKSHIDSEAETFE